MTRALSCAAVLLCGATAACTPEPAPVPDAPPPGSARAATLRPEHASTYVPTLLEDGSGTIRGEIVYAGTVAADSLVRPLFDADVCGTEVSSDVARVYGDHVAGTMVWLADARTGKRLPQERRFEILTEHCRLVPRVQGAILGGTLNVRSEDAAMHRTRFTAYPSGRPLAVVRENDAGQVVPVEQVLGEPGQVAVTCDVHPWTRGWIFVFDHPYFATSDRSGAFVLDSVPPGRYRIVAWHERLGVADDTVWVTGGQVSRVRLTLPGG